MQLASAVQLGAPAIIPWPFLSIADTPALQLQCARSYALANFPAAASQPRRRAHAIHERIRIAYLSADFRDHPVAQLLAGIFEKHDRSRFEITAVSLRPADASSLGARVLTAVEHSVDVSRESDSAAAEALRKRHVDIAVDLQGFTHGMRTAILAHRAAPVQVNYLGYPGTMGAQYLDYLIADDVVIPREEEDHYTERIVRLPHSYLPFDNSQRIATRPSRAAAGLPAAGFVFCVFNNHYKITPVVFDIWMRLLRDVPDSILWLRPAGARTIANLRREAIARGVDAERLVIAPWVAGTEEHLARQQLADLFLDTLPYNAHATAIQALWSGVPVLTCRGTTFAGRVGASLLSAVGLPELIASDLREYEHTALRLARDPAALAAIRECLVAARTQRPLFDTETSCRDLERAFTWMVDRQRRGEPPTGVTFAPMR